MAGFMGANVAQLKAELETERGPYLGHAHGRARFGNTLAALLDAAPPPADLLDIGGDVSDFESRPPEKRQPYSFGKYFRRAGYNYASVNVNDLDARREGLPFADNSFEVVTAWEIIEHLWLMDGGGCLNWDGPLFFWREAHRVLKPGGLFFCATRNRWCPLAWAQMRGGKNGCCFAAAIEGDQFMPGHAREWTTAELAALADHTGTYEKREVRSVPSVTPRMAKNLAALVPRLESLIGRKFLPEERHDTIFFMGRKR